MRTLLLTALSFLAYTASAQAADAPTSTAGTSASASASCAAWLDHRIGKLHSEETLDLCELTAGKPVLIVNTASFCGYTPQFKGLEALYQRWQQQGLVVIGFPSDDFFQEANDEAETADICYINYGVTFPMTSTVKVRGRNAHPVFRHLHQAGQPLWNFNKYLVGPDGSIIEHFGSNTAPEAAALNAAIEAALQQ